MVKEGHNDTISALPLATPIAISCAHRERETDWFCGYRGGPTLWSRNFAHVSKEQGESSGTIGSQRRTECLGQNVLRDFTCNERQCKAKYRIAQHTVAKGSLHFSLPSCLTRTNKTSSASGTKEVTIHPHLQKRLPVLWNCRLSGSSKPAIPESCTAC